MQDTCKVQTSAKCCHLALHSQNFYPSFMTFHSCLDVGFPVAWFLWRWEGILPGASPSGSVRVGGRGRCHRRLWGQSNARCSPATPRPAHGELQGHSQRRSEQKRKVALLGWKQISSAWIISKSNQAALKVQTASFWSRFQSPLDAHLYSKRYRASGVTPFKLWYVKTSTNTTV